MAKTVIGNPNAGEYATVFGLTENEDGEPTDCELICDSSFVGYQYTAKEDLHTDAVDIGFYVRIPSTDGFDLAWGDPPNYAVPVVCTLNSNLFPVELLNASCEQVSLSGIHKQWVVTTVPLKRTWKEGEIIFVGVYGHWLCPVWDTGRKDLTGSPIELQCDGYYIVSGKNGIARAMEAGGMIAGTRWIAQRNYQFSVYAAFSSPSTFTVGLTARSTIKEKFSRKARYSKTAEETALPAETAGRTHVGNRLAGCERTLLNTTTTRTSSHTRSTSDQSAVSAITRLGRILTTCVTGLLNLTAPLKTSRGLRYAIAEALQLSSHQTRETMSFRNQDEVVAPALSVRGGRWLIRSIQTAMCWWDALLGRIRGENCTVRLYCPITTELHIEGHIR